MISDEKLKKRCSDCSNLHKRSSRKNCRVKEVEEMLQEIGQDFKPLSD